MNISTYSAHIIRDGINAARLDIAEHDGDHRHEPARAAADCISVGYGSLFLYSQLAEKAYVHTIDREEPAATHQTANSAVVAASTVQTPPRLAV